MKRLIKIAAFALVLIPIGSALASDNGQPKIDEIIKLLEKSPAYPAIAAIQSGGLNGDQLDAEVKKIVREKDPELYQKVYNPRIVHGAVKTEEDTRDAQRALKKQVEGTEQDAQKQLLNATNRTETTKNATNNDAPAAEPTQPVVIQPQQDNFEQDSLAVALNTPDSTPSSGHDDAHLFDYCDTEQAVLAAQDAQVPFIEQLKGERDAALNNHTAAQAKISEKELALAQQLKATQEAQQAADSVQKKLSQQDAQYQTDKETLNKQLQTAQEELNTANNNHAKAKTTIAELESSKNLTVSQKDAELAKQLTAAQTAQQNADQANQKNNELVQQLQDNKTTIKQLKEFQTEVQKADIAQQSLEEAFPDEVLYDRSFEQQTELIHSDVQAALQTQLDTTRNEYAAAQSEIMRLKDDVTNALQVTEGIVQKNDHDRATMETRIGMLSTALEQAKPEDATNFDISSLGMPTLDEARHAVGMHQAPVVEASVEYPPLAPVPSMELEYPAYQIKKISAWQNLMGYVAQEPLKTALMGTVAIASIYGVYKNWKLIAAWFGYGKEKDETTMHHIAKAEYEKLLAERLAAQKAAEQLAAQQAAQKAQFAKQRAEQEAARLAAEKAKAEYFIAQQAEQTARIAAEQQAARLAHEIEQVQKLAAQKEVELVHAREAAKKAAAERALAEKIATEKSAEARKLSEVVQLRATIDGELKATQEELLEMRKQLAELQKGLIVAETSTAVEDLVAQYGTKIAADGTILYPVKIEDTIRYAPVVNQQELPQTQQQSKKIVRVVKRTQCPACYTAKKICKNGTCRRKK